MEIDVIVIASNGGSQTVYVCEVITHLDGDPYSGTSNTDRWAEFGNDSYQQSMEKSGPSFIHTMIT